MVVCGGGTHGRGELSVVWEGSEELANASDYLENISNLRLRELLLIEIVFINRYISEGGWVV